MRGICACLKHIRLNCELQTELTRTRAKLATSAPTGKGATQGSRASAEGRLATQTSTNPRLRCAPASARSRPSRTAGRAAPQSQGQFQPARKHRSCSKSPRMPATAQAPCPVALAARKLRRLGIHAAHRAAQRACSPPASARCALLGMRAPMGRALLVETGLNRTHSPRRVSRARRGAPERAGRAPRARRGSSPEPRKGSSGPSARRAPPVRPAWGGYATSAHRGSSRLRRLLEEARAPTTVIAQVFAAPMAKAKTALAAAGHAATSTGRARRPPARRRFRLRRRACLRRAVSFAMRQVLAPTAPARPARPARRHDQPVAPMCSAWWSRALKERQWTPRRINAPRARQASGRWRFQELAS